MLLATLAGPAAAQVDWSIAGDTGSSACPSGQSELNPTIATVAAGSLKKDSVGISTIGLTHSSVASYATTDIGGGRTIYLEVKRPNGQRVGSRATLGAVRILPAQTVSARTTTVSSLAPDTRYTVEVVAASELIGKSCFRTAADLEIPFGSGRSVGPGDSWSSGCFAFGGTRNQILACMCGARNASGQWARTDSQDGYEYIISDATWRQSVGCTTN